MCLFAAPPTPAQIAAATAAFDVMLTEPDRITPSATMAALRSAGWDTATSSGIPIIPIMLRDTERTLAVADRLLASGVNAPPIVHPAVAHNEARIRLFMSTNHINHLMTALAAGTT